MRRIVGCGNRVWYAGLHGMYLGAAFPKRISCSFQLYYAAGKAGLQCEPAMPVTGTCKAYRAAFARLRRLS